MTLADQCPPEVRAMVKDLYRVVTDAYLITPPVPTERYDAQEKAFIKVVRTLKAAGFEV